MRPIKNENNKFMIQKTLKEVIGEHEILAVNGAGFGIGKDMETADLNCCKATRRTAKFFYMMPAGTKMNGFIAEYPAKAKFHGMTRL